MTTEKRWDTEKVASAPDGGKERNGTRPNEAARAARAISSGECCRCRLTRQVELPYNFLSSFFLLVGRNRQVRCVCVCVCGAVACFTSRPRPRLSFLTPRRPRQDWDCFFPTTSCHHTGAGLRAIETINLGE